MKPSQRKTFEQFILISRQSFERKMERGIRDGNFILEFQPIYDLKTGKCVTLEALVRWDYPTIGRISPEAFIIPAEKWGLVDRIGEFVLEESILAIDTLEEAGFPDISIAVNISPVQLKEKHFVDLIKRVTKEDPRYTSRLELEITETIRFDVTPEISNSIDILKAIGFRFSGDDFGTGYATMETLQKIPFDVLKIDRVFIAAILNDERTKKIVASMVALAHDLGMRVVAEGIEDRDALVPLLRDELKCGYGQGFDLCRPKPLANIIDILNQDENQSSSTEEKQSA